MNPARTPQPQPQPQPQFRRTSRHQAGRRDARPAIELLAAHSQQPGPSGAWTASARHAAPPDEPGHAIDTATAAAALGLDLTELDDLDVYAAASIVRRRAHIAIHRLYRCRPRLRRARRATGPAQMALSTAPPSFPRSPNASWPSRSPRPDWSPHWTNSKPSPTAPAPPARPAHCSTPTADDWSSPRRCTNAWPNAKNSPRTPPQQYTSSPAAPCTSCSARPRPPNASPPASNTTSTTFSTKPPLPPQPPSVTHHHPSCASCAPPSPLGSGHEWWREICSLFAEATPTERRTARLNLLTNAPRIIWTTWAQTRQQHHAPSTSAVSHPSTPSKSPGHQPRPEPLTRSRNPCTPRRVAGTRGRVTNRPN